MKTTTSLRFLGTVEVAREGELASGFRSRKALALLGYLAVQDQPISREHLAELFWKGRPEARGRANLTWVLSRIEKVVPGCVRADRHALQLARGDSRWLDVDAFEALQVRGDAASLAAAAALYRGEFLEGVSLAGCAEFELWLVGERERWRQRTVNVLRELMAHHGQRGEYEEGVRVGRRLLELEPWREEAHRQVMRLLGWSGQRAVALARYETCCQVLDEQLGVEPAEETVRLYEQIRDGDLEAPEVMRLPDFGEGQRPLQGGESAEPVFVARGKELGRLEGVLGEVLGGAGRVVFVMGDAGQGKTALIQAFVRRAQGAHGELVVAWGHGNAYTGVGDPYLPFREVLRALAGDVEGQWKTGAVGREQVRRLWATLPLTGRALVEVGPSLIDTFVAGDTLMRRAAAMAAMTPGKMGWLEKLEALLARRAAAPGSPSLQQSDLFEQYARVMRALAEDRPLVVVLDDLQWVDVGSTCLLFHLGRRIEGSRILVVGAYRPAEVAMGYPAPARRMGDAEERDRHPLAPVVGEFKRQFGEIEVDLGQAEGRAFVEAFVDSTPNRLSDGFREMLYRQTAGHPLFTVELVRGMQERGGLVRGEGGQWEEVEPLDWETLPARVEAVIGERVGRLSETSRRVLQVASVEGETFTAEAMARVRGIGEQEMVERLSVELDREQRLVRAQGLERLGGARPASGQILSHYRFRHILFQKYLYNSLDPVERVYLHQSVGTTLEQLYAEAGEGTAVIALPLARHFREAGILEKAVDYLREAGERAVRLSAHEEAVAHYTEALALLEEMTGGDGKGTADSPEQHVEWAQRELMLRVGLSIPLQALRGYDDPEVGRLYSRARELCRQVGETPYLLPVLWHLSWYYNARAEHRLAREMGEHLLALAERAENSLAAAAAHLVIGHTFFLAGEWVESRTHLERAVTLCRALEQQQSTTFLYGLDIGEISMLGLCANLTILGYPDQGLEMGREALAYAEELSYPLALVAAYGYLAMHHMYRRDPQAAWEMGEACVRVSAEQGFAFWEVVGRLCCGWALVEQGRVEEGAALLRQYIAETQATGTKKGSMLPLAGLAVACGRMGHVEKGLGLLDEALTLTLDNAEYFYEAEIHRLKGELFAMRGEEEEAASCFGYAIEVADRLDAKLWELRATVSLCRLWQQQDRWEEAQEQLARIYGWFTEGFDAPDLLEAKALLEELA